MSAGIGPQIGCDQLHHLKDAEGDIGVRLGVQCPLVRDSECANQRHIGCQRAHLLRRALHQPDCLQMVANGDGGLLLAAQQGGKRCST